MPDDDPTASTVEGVELRVLLFSVLREIVGTGELRLQLRAPVRGEDVLGRLVAEYPATETYRSVVRLAVNRVYAPLLTELCDGDEVALITPVSGG
ncbi:MAG: MoaD/ThiS family protein [Bacteroidota bacterium]